MDNQISLIEPNENSSLTEIEKYLNDVKIIYPAPVLSIRRAYQLRLLLLSNKK